VIISFETDYSFVELKNDIIDFYLTRSLDNLLEMDILAIAGQGIVIKDWRQKRNYIALESGPDTMMWVFILLNEYMNPERGNMVEFRNYLKKDIIYNEY